MHYIFIFYMLITALLPVMVIINPFLRIGFLLGWITGVVALATIVMLDKR